MSTFRLPSDNPEPADLVHYLGGDAFVLPLPTGDNAELSEVGSLRGLPVWSAKTPAMETTHTARRLARHGKLGVLISHDQSTERWLIAITLQPVRLVTVAAGDRNALALVRLARAARTARDTPLEHAIAFAEALDIDAAGRQTFRLLHQLLDRAVSLLPGSVPRDDRHAWALAQITRLLFLRFVESEGWLDGNPRFLAAAFDRCLMARRDPARHLLHPLFFGTLNRGWDARSRFAKAFGAIPFLNGGLFEPHAIERKYRFHLPVAYWRDAFAALVDRVDVTLDAGVADGRVTPELLGRVFEGAMQPVERKKQGTFFTPPELVQAIMRRTLACHLAPKLRRSEEAIDRGLDDPDVELQRALLNLTVLDPAVGSGAFLVGALDRLHGPGPRDPTRVRHLVTRRLFGVDRHPGAVRLCELRLWLEVLRAMRGRPPARIPPLPNLDAHVRAGDALIDPLHGEEIALAAARRIAQGQRSILGAHGAAKRAAIADANRAERKAVMEALLSQEAGMDHEITELLAEARAPTLFGDRPRLSRILTRELGARRRERREIRAERRRLAHDATAAPFAIRAAFAPVFARHGGFDLVVGNPPWVRAEHLPVATRSALASRYRWWRSGPGRGWSHLPDLAVAFVERGFGLLAPGGTLGFIVPSKLATAGYASACRAALTSRSTIHCVADLSDDPRAGFEATTYPLALVTSRRLAPLGHAIRLGLSDRDAAQPQSQWVDAASWMTAPPEVQRIASRLARQHPHLAGRVTPQLGVKTGANSTFLDPPEEFHRWCRPALRGRDIRPFSAKPSALLLWPADSRGVPWRTLPPALAQYLDQHAARLRRRADQQRGPWWQLFRTGAATARYRVAWRDLARGLQAAVLRQDEIVPLNSCYVAALPSLVVAESLAAWLNSTPVRALARLNAEAAAGGCARFGARTIGGVPLPHAVLGHRMLASFARDASHGDIQQGLDECVGELLGLSAPEYDLLVGLAAHRR